LSQAGYAWTGRQIGAAVVFVAWVGAQFSIPLLPSSGPALARFRWQMFASYQRPSRYLIERADGSVREVPLEAYAGSPRSDVDFDAVMPGHLCAEVAGAVAVVVESGEARASRRQPCAR